MCHPSDLIPIANKREPNAALQMPDRRVIFPIAIQHKHVRQPNSLNANRGQTKILNHSSVPLKQTIQDPAKNSQPPTAVLVNDPTGLTAALVRAIDFRRKETCPAEICLSPDRKLATRSNRDRKQVQIHHRQTLPIDEVRVGRCHLETKAALDTSAQSRLFVQRIIFVSKPLRARSEPSILNRVRWLQWM